MSPTRHALLLTMLSLTLASSSAAEFGRWTWDAGIGLRQRSSWRDSGGERRSEFDLRGLELSAAVKGYLGHPSIGNFRLGLDYTLEKDAEQSRIDIDELGIDAFAQILPSARYSGEVFFRSGRFAYASPSELLSTASLPETSQRWGAKLGIADGPLRGLRASVQGTEQDFVDPDLDPDRHRREYLIYDRPLGSLRNSLRLEHRKSTYGLVGFETEDLIGTLKQSLQGKGWNWQLDATSLLRDLEAELGSWSYQDHRLRTLALIDVRERDLLDLRYELAVYDAQDARTRTAHTLGGIYRWRLEKGWEIGPLLAFDRVTAGSRKLDRQRLGLDAGWSGRSGLWYGRWSGRGGYTSVQEERDTTTSSLDQDNLFFGFGGTLGYRLGGNGHRQELEVEWRRNELSFDVPPSRGSEVTPILGRDPGTSDFARARLTLLLHWQPLSLTLWGEWRQQTSAGDLQVGELDSELFSVVAQLEASRFSLALEAGEGEAIEAEVGRELSDYYNATASVRLSRRLSLQGSYRETSRQPLLTPELVSEQWEATLQWRFGATYLQARYYRWVNTLGSQPESLEEGFQWSLTRGFGGGLPVVTGARRRGTIR